MGDSWVCSYCGHRQVPGTNVRSSWAVLPVGQNEFGTIGGGFFAAACLNPQCERLTLHAKLTTRYQTSETDLIRDFQLLPESNARPQPDFIPAVIVQDYTEACRIQHLSPKASATLSRRCLQGMIRDFTGVTKARLVDEINELRIQVDAGSAPPGVTPESIDAIDAVRSVGNIGAHMEKQIDLIVEIEPGEAQTLIELIEMLFDEWYVARNKRQARLEAVKALSEAKKQELADAKAKKAALEASVEMAALPAPAKPKA